MPTPASTPDLRVIPDLRTGVTPDAFALYQHLCEYPRLCRGTGESFYTERGEIAKVRRAKALCARCPAQQMCRQYAVETGDEFGIWGGTSPTERQQLRRELAYKRGWYYDGHAFRPQPGYEAAAAQYMEIT
jgi:Transcription factor WhiB